jgi:hypothetical protein
MTGTRCWNWLENVPATPKDAWHVDPAGHPGRSAKRRCLLHLWYCLCDYFVPHPGGVLALTSFQFATSLL